MGYQPSPIDMYTNKFIDVVDSHDIRIKVYMYYRTARRNMLAKNMIDQQTEIANIILREIYNASSGKMNEEELTSEITTIGFFRNLMHEKIAYNNSITFPVVMKYYMDLLIKSCIYTSIKTYSKLVLLEHELLFKRHLKNNLDQNHTLCKMFLDTVMLAM